MDPVLAELYGTVTPQEDIEKTAQLDLLQKIAEAHDIDLDQLSDEQILEAVEALDGVEKVAEEQSVGGMDKEAEELFRNSDYGGRIFAHAMIDELRSIQKQAAGEYGNPLLSAVMLEKEAKTKGQMGREFNRILTTGTVEKAPLKERVTGALRSAGESIKKAPGQAVGRADKLTQRLGRALAGQGNLSRAAARRVGGGALGAGAALAGTAGLGAAAAMRKKSFDEAVYERAAEHLAAAGLIDDSGEVLSPEYSEKTAQDVDAAALGLLEQMGYPVEWY
jgi:hypothetical protein